MADILRSFQIIQNSIKENGNATNVTSNCETSINDQILHAYLLIPSVVTMLILAFMTKRTKVGLDLLDGRPGIVYPMDILGRTNRFSYAAAWGMVAYLAADVVLNKTLAVNIEGSRFVTVFAVLLSMLVYGMDYLPLFASLAHNSLLGYSIGTLYAWMFFYIQIVKSSECNADYQKRLLVILRDVPSFLCLGYLSISFPVRIFRQILKRQYTLHGSETLGILDLNKDLRSTVEGLHCVNLLKPPAEKSPPPEDKLSQVKNAVIEFIETLLYKRLEGFRYSSRVLSVVVIGVILLYKITVEFLIYGIAILYYYEAAFSKTRQTGQDQEDGDNLLRFIIYSIHSIRGCFVTSIVLTTIVGLVMILHTLTSYRENLFAVYRGDYSHIPPRTVQSNAGLLVGSMQYAGYQVGYIVWGYMIQLVMFMLITLCLAVTITLIRHDIYDWLLDLIHYMWPVVLITVAINILQIVVAKYLFLQDQGEVLAFDNRRVLFTFTFFLFFYNIFLGLFSCLLRIIKAIIIGALFMSRLDNSTLPRRFQMMDPGFAAYVGFIHVENAHTNPVVISFLKILMMNVKMKKERKGDERNGQGPKIESGPSTVKKTCIKANLLFRPYVKYTLYRNPQLFTLRGEYLEKMKALRYNLSHTAVGELIHNINSSGNVAAGISQPEEQQHEDGGTPGDGQIDGWRELMNRFMANIQRYISRQQRRSQRKQIIGTPHVNMNVNEVTDADMVDHDVSSAIQQNPVEPTRWDRLRVAVGVDQERDNQNSQGSQV